MAAKPYSTPPKYARELGVKPDKVIGWIRSGELRAIDVSLQPGIGRPRWRIPWDAIVAFENARTNRPAIKPVKQSRRKKQPDVIQFF